jgi:hypothetical protein
MAQDRSPGMARDDPGRPIPSQRLRALRHDRQRMGVDLRLLRDEVRRRLRAPASELVLGCLPEEVEPDRPHM